MTGDDMLINSIRTIRHPFKLVLWLLLLCFWGIGDKFNTTIFKGKVQDLNVSMTEVLQFWFVITEPQKLLILIASIAYHSKEGKE